MSVEFRCPDCRSKLRLAEAPPPGEEIECPKCGVVFPVPDLDAEAPPPRKSRPADNDDEPPRKKKKKPAAEGGEKPTAKDGDGKPKPAEGPKKRRAKKKKANKTVLIAAVAGGVVAVGLMVLALFLLLSREPPAVQMMAYLPEDSDYASGINFGQFQKYPVFYKDFERLFEDPYITKRLVQPLNTALNTDFHDLVDYTLEGGTFNLTGGGDSSVAFIIRTKTEFDPGLLAKLPRATEETIDGVKVFTVPDWHNGPEAGTVRGFGSVKVFAPTNRIIVLTSSRIARDKLQKMVSGNKGNPEASFVGRMGPLGKRIARGNLWRVHLFKKGAPPVYLFDPGGSARDASGKRTGSKDSYDIGEVQGNGFRMNIGAKTMRGEMVYWCNSSDQASSVSKAWGESELAKGDEGNPPKFWKEWVDSMIGDKLLGAQLLSSLSFSASGELFVIKLEGDNKKLQEKFSGWATTFNTPPAKK